MAVNNDVIAKIKALQSKNKVAEPEVEAEPDPVEAEPEAEAPEEDDEIAALQAKIAAAKKAKAEAAAKAAAAAAAKAKPKATAANGSGYTLFVDCLPVGEEYTDASGLLKAANESVCSEHGVSHYRMIDYGKAAGALSAAVQSAAAELSGNVYVSTRGNAGRDALDALRWGAARVVQST